MKIQLFKNKKGLIHGSDPKRISCDQEGVLKIGTTEITVFPEDSILPILFQGISGTYKAIFIDKGGHVYELESVEVKSGRIAPPSPIAVELMELRCRADAAEDEYKALREKIRALEKIFDTDSLNFLIK